jgi:uncharacterized membrane protein YhiD involved in acid resistance
MPDWLRNSIQTEIDLSLSTLAVRQAVALMLGCVVAGIYRLMHGKSSRQSLRLMATLVLLAVLIGMVTMVIGSNVARAFSLVGALSIVRFRTVVEDTRDTAFVIFAVAVGMAVGSGFSLVALVGIPFAALAALLFRPRLPRAEAAVVDYSLTVRLGAGEAPEVLLRASFAKHLERAYLTSMATARQGAAIDLTYQVRPHSEEAAIALVTELNGLEGIQSAEIHRR